jgi:hypothetical protein
MSEHKRREINVLFAKPSAILPELRVVMVNGQNTSRNERNRNCDEPLVEAVTVSALRSVTCSQHGVTRTLHEQSIYGARVGRANTNSVMKYESVIPA